MNQYLIRVIGKSQESWQTEAIHSYLNKLKGFAKVEIIELEEKHGGSAKPNEEKTKQEEGQALTKNLPKNAIIIAVDETGKNLSSVEFAQKIDTWSEHGQTLVFCIGGSWGLSDEVKRQAQHMVSFGKQTLPHVLARIVLLEQLYRAETILKGKTYHK